MTATLRTTLAAAGFLLVAAFFLTAEHRAHVFGVLPYLLVLACPLLHVFGHGRHGGHEVHVGHRTAEREGDASIEVRGEDAGHVRPAGRLP